MNILVTGASGFLGSHLCQALSGLGHHVKAFYRPRLNGDIPVLLKGMDVEHVVGDITDNTSLEYALKDVKIVFHTAARLGSGGNPQELYAITVQGTQNVLQAARHAGVERVIHTSSVAALGVPGYKQPPPKKPQAVDENHTWNFPPEWWRYGHGKYLAELEVQKAVALGQDVVIVNPGVILGPGDINQIGGDVIIKVSSGRFPISLPGGLNIVHIEDVVKGQIAAWQRGRTGERYILGGENLSHLTFHRQIAQICAVKPPQHMLPALPVRALAKPLSYFSKYLPVSASSLYRVGYFFYYSSQKAGEELGYSEILSSHQAILDAYNWYKQAGIL
jgi:dihydroflavonol-4-reductase